MSLLLCLIVNDYDGFFFLMMILHAFSMSPNTRYVAYNASWENVSRKPKLF